jgi:hypothetical protein
MEPHSVKPNLRDFQRTKFYRFEETVIQRHPLNQPLSLDQCRALAHKYNATVLVKDGRGRRHAGASYEYNLITLPRWSRQTSIVLHEVAHTLVDSQYYPHHGAEFAGVLIGLLSREAIGTVESNMEAMLTARLKIDIGWIFGGAFSQRNKTPR